MSWDALTGDIVLMSWVADQDFKAGMFFSFAVQKVI